MARYVGCAWDGRKRETVAAGHDPLFDLGFAALLAADSLSLLLRFAWLAQLSIADGLSLFKKHMGTPTNSETRTFLWLGNFGVARWSKRDQLLSFPACYDVPPMSLQDIIQQLDQQIERLQQARKHLTGSEGERLSFATTSRERKRRGPRRMSAEARARIAAAQRARWARVKAGQKKK